MQLHLLIPVNSPQGQKIPSRSRALAKPEWRSSRRNPRKEQDSNLRSFFAGSITARSPRSRRSLSARAAKLIAATYKSGSSIVGSQSRNSVVRGM
ncbi:hypothetical protein MTP99_018281 [Tenebrio molitor]|nr:hypothetical protein MTP99_018281 [Tenebrio molitor]